MTTSLTLALLLALSAGEPQRGEEGGVVVPARAKGDLGALIGNGDYPAAALRNGEQGIVAFRITIGADGRVSDCVITASSGSSALDATTCRILRSRARFTPALDAEGDPTEDSATAQIAWRISAPAPPVAE